MTAQTPKEGVFTELFHRRPVDPGLVRQALGAFEKEVVDLAFYWLGLGNRGGYTVIMTEVLKGFPRLAENPLRRVPTEGTWGDLWELYGISEAGDKAINSVVLGQFSEDQESEKPSQFVRCLPVDLRNPLTKHFARLFFPWTLATEQIRRYRGAVSCLKRFCATPALPPVPPVPEGPMGPKGPGERIFSSAVADKLLAPVFLTMARIYDVECVTEAKIPEDTVFMCDFSESMWGRPLAISLTIGIMSGRVLTFDTETRWHTFLAEDSLRKKVASIRSFGRHGKVDLQKAYQLVGNKKYLVIITDMDYEDVFSPSICVKGECMVIVWNVSARHSGPYAVLREEGVAQMYGWSDAMWEMVKTGIRVITPMELVSLRLAVVPASPQFA
jgi:hypothetical protein